MNVQNMFGSWPSVSEGQNDRLRNNHRGSTRNGGLLGEPNERVPPQQDSTEIGETSVPVLTRVGRQVRLPSWRRDY